MFNRLKNISNVEIRKTGLLMILLTCLVMFGGCKENVESVFENYEGTITNLLSKEKGKATLVIKKVTKKNLKTGINYNPYYQVESDLAKEHIGQYFYQVYLDFGNEGYGAYRAKKIYFEGYTELKENQITIDTNESYITNIWSLAEVYFDELREYPQSDKLTDEEMETLNESLYNSFYEVGDSWNASQVRTNIKFWKRVMQNNGAISFQYSDISDEEQEALTSGIDELGYFNPENGKIVIKFIDGKPMFLYNNKTYQLKSIK